MKDIEEMVIKEPHIRTCKIPKLIYKRRIPNNKFTRTSPYPLAIRDLSLTIDKNVLSNQISDIIKQNPLVTDLNVIDVYSDLEPGKKSITFRITYQSFNETLNNEKIDESQNKILNKLNKQLNIELRKI